MNTHIRATAITQIENWWKEKVESFDDKMKIIQIISTVLIISLSFSLYGQENEDSLILKNKVKAIYEVRWDSQFNELTHVDTIGYKVYNDDSKLIEEYSKTYPFKYKYLYNNDGLQVKKLKLDGQSDEKIERVWKFEYNKDGQLIKEVSYWTEFKGKHPIIYSYNEQKQLINTSHLNYKNEVYKSLSQKYYETGELYENKYEEKYNKSALKIERFDKCGNLTYLSKNGEQDSLLIHHNPLSPCLDLLKKETYLVDTLFTESDKIELIRYSIQDKNRKSIYSYDSSENLINVAKHQFKKDGSLNGSLEESYNKQGKLIEYQAFYHRNTCNYDSNTSMHRIHKKYEYYQNGMLSKIYFLDENRVNIETINYKIVYRE